MRVITNLDKNAWKNFIDENPQGNIFQTPEMYEVFSRTKGYRPNLWATIGDNNQILALFLPVQVVLYGGPLKIFTTRAISYGGIVTCDGPTGQEALSLLLQTYNRQVPIWPILTELRNHFNLSDLRELLTQNGYTHEDHLNYLIDLKRDPDVIFGSFNTDARRRIQKNLKRGVITVRDMTNRSLLPTFYGLLKKTYQHARIPLADISLFEATFDVLLPKKMARFILVYVDNVPVTASLSLLYKDVIYGWYNGTDRAYRKFGPNESEVWELINWGINNGYGVFDFGGAGKPGEDYGVREFKAKFNGQLVNYGRNTYIHAAMRMKLSKITYGIARYSISRLHNRINEVYMKKAK